jgi:hypothetical protein
VPRETLRPKSSRHNRRGPSLGANQRPARSCSVTPRRQSAIRRRLPARTRDTAEWSPGADTAARTAVRRAHRSLAWSRADDAPAAGCGAFGRSIRAGEDADRDESHYESLSHEPPSAEEDRTTSVLARPSGARDGLLGGAAVPAAVHASSVRAPDDTHDCTRDGKLSRVMAQRWPELDAPA